MKKGLIEVKYKVKHPMETGLRKAKDGNLVPEEYITNIKISKNGTPMINIDTNSTVSSDPYLYFRMKGAKGDVINLSWVSNTGEKNSADTKVK